MLLTLFVKNNRPLVSAGLILLMFLVVPVFPVFPDSTGASRAYRLGAEDVVSISILAGGEEQVSKNLVVGDNGEVNVPFIGKVPALGLTLEELEKRILAPLAQDYFVDPQVHLQITEYRSLQFFISGAVKNPGMYSLDFTPTILDLLAHAGGALPERGNLAYILRGGPGLALSETELEEVITKADPILVDLNKLLDDGNMSENLVLKSGDTIYIPLGTRLNQAATKIYVQGKVKKPGVFDYQPGLTALAACIMAEGFDKFAAPNRARIIRQTTGGQQIIQIDLKSVQKGDIPDVPLQPGDRIHIPEAWL